MSDIKFEPWIGNKYESEGLIGVKVLVLGESHYLKDKKPDNLSDFTIYVIKSIALSRRPHKFFKTIHNLLADKEINDEPKNWNDIWDRICFYNFVQRLLPRNAKRPENQDWEDAKEPFNKTMRNLNPHLVIVFGVDLKNHLPEMADGFKPKFIYVRHPSSWRFLKKNKRDELYETGREQIRNKILELIPSHS
jgi:hypothetical protein